MHLSRLTGFATAALLVLLAACGGNDDAPEPTEEPIVIATATATEAPPAATQPPAPTPTATPTPPPLPETDPAISAARPPIPTPVPGVPEVSLTVVVDKERALPDGYIPPNLAWIPNEWLIPGYADLLVRSEALDAFARLRETALADGHDIRVRSAYRSYEEQVWTFDYWVSVYGEEQARRVSAPPGHSEHQLGTAIDFSVAEVGWELSSAFGDTAAGRWMFDHAHEYGFALSYPADGEPVTGYVYEPWHWRYIGVDAAQAWRASGLILVEFLESIQ